MQRLVPVESHRRVSSDERPQAKLPTSAGPMMMVVDGSGLTRNTVAVRSVEARPYNKEQ
jgi:hypothetical protein